MKLKLFLVITDPERFLTDPARGLSVWGYDPEMPHWQTVGTIDVEINPDTQRLVETAELKLDEALKEARTIVHDIEERKKNLLALPAPK